MGYTRDDTKDGQGGHPFFSFTTVTLHSRLNTPHYL